MAKGERPLYEARRSPDAFAAPQVRPLKVHSLAELGAIREAMRQAAQADADYDRWFHAKAQAALDDPRPAIEPEDWPQIRTQRLAALKQRLGL